MNTWRRCFRTKKMDGCSYWGTPGDGVCKVSLRLCAIISHLIPPDYFDRICISCPLFNFDADAISCFLQLRCSSANHRLRYIRTYYHIFAYFAKRSGDKVVQPSKGLRWWIEMKQAISCRDDCEHGVPDKKVGKTWKYIRDGGYLRRGQTVILTS
jgi:hypothetical protein